MLDMPKEAQEILQQHPYKDDAVSEGFYTESGNYYTRDETLALFGFSRSEERLEHAKNMIEKNGIKYKTKEIYDEFFHPSNERCDWQNNIEVLFEGDTIIWNFVHDMYQGFARVISQTKDGKYKYLPWAWCSCWSDQDVESLRYEINCFDTKEQLISYRRLSTS